MVQGGIRLPFRAFGIPILLDWTFLLVLPIIAWLISNNLGAVLQQTRAPVDHQPLLEGFVRYLLGLSAAIGLFAGVLIHEVGHALVARTYGVRVRSISLWLLGGVAQLEEMPRQPGAEAVVAIAGPVTSFILALFFWFLIGFIPPEHLALYVVIHFLAQANLILAIFNLLPALPLDGGRVLRSLLSLRTGYIRATRTSAMVSRIIAVGLGFVGLLYGQVFLVLIALFIYMAVQQEIRSIAMTDALADLSVRNLMTRNVITVPPNLSVDGLRQLMMQARHHSFPVTDPQLRGVVSIDDIQGAPPDTAVAQVMSPQPRTINEWANAMDALDHMTRLDLACLMVVDQFGNLVGIITRLDLLRAIHIHTSGTPLAQAPRPKV